ncbi:MAG TPA: winged helix-turn-helix domain-containing protein [Planctomycetota bacterium]|nr:winged helix-turn-helix domain-containing protein [Planctomycetota bacterium]
MSSAINLSFTRAQKRALLRQRRVAPNVRVWNRATGLLLLAAKVASSEILQSLGISRKTLLNWKRRWLSKRHFGLEDAPREGRPPEMSEAHLRLLLRVVRRDPRQVGYAFTRWTAPRLAEYVALRTGVRVTPAWITELLRRNGFVWRKTKRTLRNLQNRSATQKAWRALKRLKKGLWSPGPVSNFGMATESASSCFR